MGFFKVIFQASLLGVFLLIQSPVAMSAKATDDTLPMKELQRFATALQTVKNYYVEPVKDNELFESAIRGMVEGLDPHSNYLDAQDFKELQDTTTGEFSGLGLEIMLEDGYLRVVSPIDDTPAQKAGIKPGDMIVRINSEPVKGMLLRDAIRKMRGKVGTSIVLTIYRKSESKPLKVKLTREIIKVQSIKTQMLTKDFGYLRISSFQANSGVDLIKGVNDLKKQAGGKLRGLILDLRNDPGGLLDTAVEITNTFLDSDKLGKDHLIVYTKGRLPGSQYAAKATSSDILKGAPMVVLINEGSASGAEIVAGALQDYKRAVIVGTKSFGKGSVQTVLPLDNDTALKLTTAFYYTPSGRSIQATGIQPDIVVEAMPWPPVSKKADLDESFKEADLMGHLLNQNRKNNAAEPTNSEEVSVSNSPLSNMPNPKTDYQLDQALNVLRGLVAIQNKTASASAR